MYVMYVCYVHVCIIIIVCTLPSFFSATKTTIANLDDSSQICLLKDVYFIVYPTFVLIVSLYQHHVGECRELSLGGNCMYQINTF